MITLKDQQLICEYTWHLCVLNAKVVSRAYNLQPYTFTFLGRVLRQPIRSCLHHPFGPKKETPGTNRDRQSAHIGFYNLQRIRANNTLQKLPKPITIPRQNRTKSLSLTPQPTQKQSPKYKYTSSSNTQASSFAAIIASNQTRSTPFETTPIPLAH